MRLLIIGATGGLGTELVRQALEHGHQVTALVRNQSVVALEHAHLGVARGDVLDGESLGAAVAEQEAVVSTLGTPNPRKPSTLLSEGTKNIVGAMERHGVRRFLGITILGTGDSGRHHASPFYRLFVLGYFVRPMLEDKERQEQIIRRSNLDWTIVRPPRYTDEPGRGDYRVITDGEGRVGKIGRADLANFLLDLLDDNSYVRKAVVVGY